MSNYGHIVYAGGAHGITLKGAPSVSSGGYQIVEVSRNMTDGSIKYDSGVVEHVIKFTCSDKPVVKSDVDSYFYCAPEVGASLLIRLAKRGTERLESIEDTGFMRRPDVNEVLVGISEVYPCQLMGSPAFSALDTDPRIYYREQSPAPQDNVDISQVANGTITREMAMEFALQHEQEVRKLAYYLLDQISRAPSTRRAVAIRDTEANVRLWVAAATYSLPLVAALRVSFNTKVIEVIRPQVQLVYGVQKNDGSFIKDYNIQNPNLEQRLCAMVFGVDPERFTEVQLKQKTPNKPFITLSEIEAPDITAPYFADMVTNDKKILSFNECMRDLRNCPCDLRLTRVYDAYCVLSAIKYNSYSEIGKALDVMGSLFSEKSYLLCYVMDQITKDLKAGEWDADLQNVVCKLVKLLPQVGTADVGERFENALRDYLGMSIARLRDLSGCAQIAKALEAVPERAKKVLVPAIGNAVLKDEATAALVGSAKEADILQLLQILDSYRCASGEKWITLLQAGDPIIASVVRRVIASEDLTEAFMTVLGDDTQAVDAFMIEGIKTLDTDKNRRVKWWLSMVTHNVPLYKLCALIARSGEKGDIEAILCAQIRKRGQTREIQELFSQYLANDPNAGADYYSEWMRSLSKDPERLKGIKSILTSLGSNSAQSEIYKKVLRSLDDEIEYVDTHENEQLAQMVSQFASRARVRSPNAEVFTYLQNMTKKGGSIFRSKSVDAVEAYLKHNEFAQVYEVKEGFTSSKMCESYITTLLDYPEEPSTYIILASSFVFSSPRDERAYFEAIADRVCAVFLKKRSLSLSTLVYTADCVGAGDAMRKDAAARILEKLDGTKLLNGLNQMLHACEALIREEKTDGIADKVISETGRQFGAKTAKHLEQILDEAREYYQKNHKGGFFGKLFGKR